MPCHAVSCRRSLGEPSAAAPCTGTQGFVVAASARTATLCCACHLAPATRKLLASRPAAAALLGGTDPGLLCEAYALGLQILVSAALLRREQGCMRWGVADFRVAPIPAHAWPAAASPHEWCNPCLAPQVGYAATTAVGLFAEWRQRKAFAAKHQLPPPSHMDIFALNGAFVSMLFFLWRVALAEAVRLPATSCSVAAAAAGACPAAL